MRKTIQIKVRDTHEQLAHHLQAGAGSSHAEQEREQEQLQVLADYTLAIGTALNLEGKAPFEYPGIGERTRPFTALQAARLLVSREEKLQEWQKEVLRRLGEVDEEIGTTTKHVHEFVQMVRQLQGDHLDAWLEDAERDGIVELRAFALSLRKDYQAVKAGLTLSWSNGPTEAQIQRLKLLKRIVS